MLVGFVNHWAKVGTPITFFQLSKKVRDMKFTILNVSKCEQAGVGNCFHTVVQHSNTTFFVFYFILFYFILFFLITSVEHNLFILQNRNSAPIK